MENSIKQFLNALHGALVDKEHFRLDITRNGDTLDIIALPLLSDDESKVPDAAKQVRSALSMPLAMRNMTMDELSEEFSQRLSGFGQARQQATDAYSELLASLQDATAAAKNSTSKADKKAKAKEKQEAPAATSQESAGAEKPTDTPPAEKAPADTVSVSESGDKNPANLFDFG